MKKSGLLLSSIFCLFCLNTIGQTNMEKALASWEKGNISEAYQAAVQDMNNDSKALFLVMKADFVQGKYSEVLDLLPKMTKHKSEYPELVDLVIESYLHLNKFTDAYKFGEENKSKRVPYLKELSEKPFSASADKTYIVPFVDDGKGSSDFIPFIKGKVNGIDMEILFDTGAEFLAMGKPVAEKLKIPLTYEDSGMHAVWKVKLWRSVAPSMSFNDGPTFKNVPVIVMEDLGNMILFGTNILEQYLSTVDYPNKRFILTPRTKPDLYKAHLDMLPADQKKMSFGMWGNHYLFGKGRFGKFDNLNFFFDSGLLVVTKINGKLVQSPFTASKESMLEWGFNKNELDKKGFIPTKFSLEAAGLSQPDTLLWYDPRLEKDRNFGGINIDGLISNAWVNHYSWTIDFDKHEFLFGVPGGK